MEMNRAIMGGYEYGPILASNVSVRTETACQGSDAPETPPHAQNCTVRGGR